MSKQIENLDYWRAHISRYLTSGVSQRIYCNQHDLPLKIFQKWRYQLRAEYPVMKRSTAKKIESIKSNPSSNQFVSVHLTQEQDALIQTKDTMKLFIDDKIHFELSHTISEQSLRLLLRVIGIAQC